MNPRDYVVNVKHGAQYDVYVGRSSRWGNVFTHLPLAETKAFFQVATRDEAIDRYAEWFETQPELIARLPELYCKRLGCHCLPLRCHAEFLAWRAWRHYLTGA